MASTLMDVFNAASHAASPFLQQGTAELKERNDLELRNNAARFATDLQDWMRDNPYNGNFDEYLGKMEKFTGERYAQAEQQQTSDYSRKMLDQMRTQTLEVARGHALAEADKWRVQQADVRFKDDAQQFMDKLPPEQALPAVQNALKLLKAERYVGPDEESRMMDAARKELYAKTLTEGLQGVQNVDELDGAIKGMKGRFEKMPGWKRKVSTVDDEGNITGEEERLWNFDGQEDWEKSLVEKETKRIQGEHWEQVRAKQSYVDRLVVSGNIDEAIRVCKQEGAEWNKAYNPAHARRYGNISDDHRDRGSGFFDWRKLEEYKKQGAKGEAMALLDAYGPEMFIRPQVQGDGTVIVGYNGDGTPITKRYASLAEAKEGFLFYKKQAFMASKGGEDAYTLQLWEKDQAEWFEILYDEVGKALQQKDKTLAADFEKFRNADRYLTKGTKESPNDYYNKDVEKMSAVERDQYGQRCVNFFENIFNNGITDGPTIRQMMRDFTGKEITKVLQYKGTRSDEAEQLKQLKKFSDKAMSGQAEDILFVKYQPENLSLGLDETGEEAGPGAGPTYVWRDTAQKDAVEKVSEDERKRTADILGLPIDNLKPRWMPSGERKGDVIPKAMFVVEEGENAGTYYLDYDERANQVVKKQKPGTRAWEEHKKVERPLTPDEQGSRNRRQADEYKQKLREGKNPITGEELEYKTQAPPTFDAQRRAAYGSSRVSDESRLQLWADYFIELQREREK